MCRVIGASLNRTSPMHTRESGAEISICLLVRLSTQIVGQNVHVSMAQYPRLQVNRFDPLSAMYMHARQLPHSAIIIVDLTSQTCASCTQIHFNKQHSFGGNKLILGAVPLYY